MASDVFDFTGRKGYRLSGKLEAPKSTPRGWAVFAGSDVQTRATGAAADPADAMIDA